MKHIVMFAMKLDVRDPQLLWDHAYYIGRQGNAFASPEEAAEMIGTRDDPNITACVVMVLDPGESPPGAEIIDSSAEVWVDLHDD